VNKKGPFPFSTPTFLVSFPFQATAAYPLQRRLQQGAFFDVHRLNLVSFLKYMLWPAQRSHYCARRNPLGHLYSPNTYPNLTAFLGEHPLPYPYIRLHHTPCAKEDAPATPLLHPTCHLNILASRLWLRTGSSLTKTRSTRLLTTMTRKRASPKTRRQEDGR
jgi:hypothetical protein